MLEVNKIHHGDCLALMPSIPDKSIDMILCDLPYGTIECKWDSIINMDRLWQEYERVIKDNGAVVLTSQGIFTAKLMVFREKWFSHDYIWVKNAHSNFALTGIQPHRVFENILVFRPPRKKDKKSILPYVYNHGAKIKREYMRKRSSFVNFEMFRSKRENKSFISKEYENYPKNVLYYNVERGMHPTQKPVALFEYLIKTYTNEGETVLDNCSGSGTTAIACINANRRYICIEQNEEYVRRSRQRVLDHEPLLNLIVNS